MGGPECDRAQDCAAAVDDGQFVIAGGQASPLFGGVESAFDDVAALVVCGIECRGPAATRPAATRHTCPTGRLRLLTSMASTARCLGVPKGTSVPSTLICSGPRTPRTPHPSWAH